VKAAAQNPFDLNNCLPTSGPDRGSRAAFKLREQAIIITLSSQAGKPCQAASITMKILESQNALLSNYEVYQHIVDQQKRNKSYKRRVPGNLATLMTEVCSSL